MGVRCIDCACCDVEKMMCHPNSMDCQKEYELDNNDLYTIARCDFFVRKK